MNALLGFSMGVDALSRLCGKLAEWCVLLAVLISAINATVRYALNYSSNAFIEIQWYLFAGIVLLGAAYTFQRNEHVRVDIIYSSVTDRTKNLIDIFGILIFLLPVSVYLTWLSWPFFMKSLLSAEASSNAGGLILWPVKMLLPTGFALMTLQGVSELIKRLASLSSGAPDVAYEKPLQ